jgi:hypothetical protein
MIGFGMLLRSHAPDTRVGRRLRVERQLAGEPEPTREALRRFAKKLSPLAMLAVTAEVEERCLRPTLRAEQDLAEVLHRREDVACVLASLEALVDDEMGRVGWAQAPAWRVRLDELKHRLVLFDLQIVKLLHHMSSCAVASDRLHALYQGIHAPHFAELVHTSPTSTEHEPPRRRSRLPEASLRELYEQLEWDLFTSPVAPMMAEAMAQEAGDSRHMELLKKLSSLPEGRQEEAYARMHTLGLSAFTLWGLAHLKKAQEACRTLTEGGVLKRIREEEDRLALRHNRRIRSEAGLRGLHKALEHFDHLHDEDFGRHLRRWQTRERRMDHEHSSQLHMMSRSMEVRALSMPEVLNMPQNLSMTLDDNFGWDKRSLEEAALAWLQSREE